MSTKTVAQKLFIKDGYDVWFINEPTDYRSILGSLPSNVRELREPSDPVDFIQFFVTSRGELSERLAELRKKLRGGGMLWVTYPKGTAKVPTDLNRDIIREYAESIGLKAVGMVSVDDTWSGLRLQPV